jgi:hypothetical protein
LKDGKDSEPSGEKQSPYQEIICLVLAGKMGSRRGKAQSIGLTLESTKGRFGENPGFDPGKKASRIHHSCKIDIDKEMAVAATQLRCSCCYSLAAAHNYEHFLIASRRIDY